MIKKSLLILLFLVPYSAFAQSGNASSFKPDSSSVDVRTVDSSTLENLTSERVFDYNEVAENPETLWSRIQRWFIQTIQWVFGNPWASTIIKFIFFAIFGLVLIALINQLLGGNLTTSFSKKNSRESISPNIAETELSKTDYDDLLQQALAGNLYRDAVRILYLKALQQLNEKELIVWKPDKTNHDYLTELASHPSRNFFNKLTTYYEYVEYGDFKIEKSGFEAVEEIYQKFHKQAGS